MLRKLIAKRGGFSRLDDVIKEFRHDSLPHNVRVAVAVAKMQSASRAARIEAAEFSGAPGPLCFFRCSRIRGAPYSF